MNQEHKIQEIAIELVERARQGDQVAMGTLCLVRENAKRGEARAIYTRDFLVKYIDANPPPENRFGQELLAPATNKAISALAQAIQSEDPVEYSTAVLALTPGNSTDALEKTAVALANGPELWEPNPRISALQAMFTTPLEAKAFAYSFQYSNQLSRLLSIAISALPTVKRAMQIGYAVGLARRIQGIRRDDVPIATLSSMAAWELGE